MLPRAYREPDDDEYEDEEEDEEDEDEEPLQASPPCGRRQPCTPESRSPPR